MIKKPAAFPKRPLRVAFCGSPHFAVASLDALCAAAQTFEVVAVITQPDKPAGRKRALLAPAVKVAAQARHLPVHQWRKWRDGDAEACLRALELDVIVVAAYGRILPPTILAIPRLGCINVHASLLPSWRGASPIARAIWHGDATTGVSIMQMDAGLDTGAVFATRAVNIAPSDTCERLTNTLAKVGAALLVDTLPHIDAGTLRATPQPREGVSLAPPLRKEDGRLHFCGNAADLARQVRALWPWPGAYLMYEHQRVAVLSAHVLPTDTPAPAGTVVSADKQGLGVACGDGVLQIEHVKPAGRSAMHAAAWIAGRGPKKHATLSTHEPADMT